MRRARPPWWAKESVHMGWQLFIPLVLVATVVVGVVLAFVARGFPGAGRWVVVTAVSVAALPLAVVIHNLVSGLVGGEEAVSFLVALLVAPAGIAAGMLGAAFAIAPRDRDLGIGVGLAGAGMALFAAYMVFALVVTTIERGNPPYQAAVEAFVLPITAFALSAGAIVTLVSAVTRDRRRGLRPAA